MNNCNIIKRQKRWGSVCPECNEFIAGGTQYFYGYHRTNSRKTAKDMLHLHLKTKHK